MLRAGAEVWDGMLATVKVFRSGVTGEEKKMKEMQI